jgi:tetratricopeptide (TPR) repeat protein
LRMPEVATARAYCQTATAPWSPVDLNTLPKNCPPPKRECAEVINLEVERAARKDADQRKAVAEFTRAIDLDPTNALGYYNRARSYQEIGKLDSAIRDYSKAIQLNPNLANAHNNRGVAYATKKEQKRALSDFDRAISLDPTRADYYNNRGNVYAAKGKLDRAITQYNQAIALDSSHADAFYNRGLTYCDKNELDSALTDFSRTISLNPKNALAYVSRSRAYRNKSEWDSVAADLAQAIRLDPRLFSDTSPHATPLTKQNLQGFRALLQSYPGLAADIRTDIEVALLQYYNLELHNDKIINDRNDLPIRTPQLRKIIQRTSAEIVQGLSAAELKPFPLMSDADLASFKKHAKNNQWNDRQKRDWPYHTNAFKYLHVTYEYWIGRGLTREHFRTADPPFYAHLNSKISKEGMPEWLDVPSGPEARARAITDPTERVELEIARKVQRARQRKHVGRKATFGD